MIITFMPLTIVGVLVAPVKLMVAEVVLTNVGIKLVAWSAGVLQVAKSQ